MATLIKSGTVITHAGSQPADVLIEGEQVVGLAAPGSHSWQADTVVEAAGKYVVPGAIDVHTHMELPFGGTFASDSFETGTRAAAGRSTRARRNIARCRGAARPALCQSRAIPSRASRAKPCTLPRRARKWSTHPMAAARATCSHQGPRRPFHTNTATARHNISASRMWLMKSERPR